MIFTTLTTRGARPLPGGFGSGFASARHGGRRARSLQPAAAASGLQITSSLPICWIGAAFRLVADFFVDRDARFAFVAEHADLDELMRAKVDLDFGQHGVGQPFGADEHDRFERVGLRAQVGALGGREFEGGHEK